MCTHKLKYVSLNIKDRRKNMRGAFTRILNASRRQRVPQSDFECLPISH